MQVDLSTTFPGIVWRPDAETVEDANLNRLPGPGTVYLGQQLRVRAPLRPATRCAW